MGDFYLQSQEREYFRPYILWARMGWNGLFWGDLSIFKRREGGFETS